MILTEITEPKIAPSHLLKNLLHGHSQLELRVFFSLEEQALTQKEYCLQE